MKPFTILLLLLSACTMRTYDCDEVDVELTREVVLDEYPDVADTFDGMDVFCVEDTDTFQTCARAGYAETEACTAWVGSDLSRGRVYVDFDEDFDAVLLHEAQHWHLMLVNDDDGCPTHEAACGWKD